MPGFLPLPSMCSNFSNFQKSTTEKEKKLVLFRLRRGLAIVGSCRAWTTTNGLLRRSLDTSNYHPSKMRAVRSPDSAPSTPLIWSCVGQGSLPSIPIVPICHNCNTPSVSLGQGVQGPPQNSPRSKTLILFTSYQKPILQYTL